MAKKKFISDAAAVFLQSHDIPEKMAEDMKKDGIDVPAEYVNHGQESLADAKKATVKSSPVKDTTPTEPQSRLSIYVPKSYHQQLKKEAVLHDMTLSEYVISLINKARR